MKKAFSLLCLFIMCSVFTLTSFGFSNVKATSTIELNKIGVVYKMVIKSDKSATYQVHQYYKKSGVEGSTTADYNSNNIIQKDVTKDPFEDGALATFYITNEGNVIMGTANQVQIENIRFFYLIANDTNASAAFCSKTYNLCENAKTVRINQNGFTHWKNEAKNGTLSYGATQIAQRFSINTDKTGKSVYKGFNIFDSIGSAYVDIAKTSGIYVIASMTISYANNEYIINEYIVENSEFSFSDRASADANSVNNTLSFTLSLSDGRYLSGAHNVRDLAKLAALIKPVDTSESDDNKQQSLSQIQNFWENILRPILIFAIGILFIIVGTTTGVKIVQSSDEPEVRSESIKKLIGMFIGAFIIEMLLIFYSDIIDIISSIIK